MKKTQKPAMKKQRKAQNEKALNKELLKIEKAFANGLRAGPACDTFHSSISKDI